MKINVIIPAGGKSLRYGEKNKLFEPVKDSVVLVEAAKPFILDERVSRVILGLDPSFSNEAKELFERYAPTKKIVVSKGGSTRFETVKNALSAVEEDADFVMVHDGARPYIKRELIDRVIEAIGANDAALPLLKLTDSVVERDSLNSVDRETLRRVQTPFIAKTSVIKRAYQNAKEAFYDDVSVVKTLDNVKIATVEGDEENAKITYSSDIKHLPLAGIGYDIHRLKDGNGIRLLGTDIDCEYSFVAHSDGDVPVHAVMDAILGALGERDIGHLYPVDDQRYDGANSMDLLAGVVKVAKDRGFCVHNVSVTIVLEKPKIAPYIDEMKRVMAKALNIPRERVGVSATTNEGVGEIGNSESVAAFATVTLIKES